MKKLLTILLLLFIIASSVMAQNNEEQIIKDLFNQLEKSIICKNLDSTMKFYNELDKDFYNREKKNYSSIFLVLETYTCSVTNVEIKDTEATVVVLTNYRYKYYDRYNSSASWSDVKLRKDDKQNCWKITDEDSRDYTKLGFVDLTMELFLEQGTVKSEAIIDLEITQPFENNLVFNLNRGLKVNSVKNSDNKDLNFNRIDNILVINFDDSLKIDQKINLKINYEGYFFNKSKEASFTQVSINKDGAFASWVTEWYPRIRSGLSKSKAKITYILPQGFTVASNGNMIEKKLENGKEKHIFKIDIPVNFGFAVAKYFHYEKEINGIKIGSYFLSGGEKKAELYLDACSRIVEYLSSIYSPYPFDNFNIVEISNEETGNLGGYSDQGMTVYPEGQLDDKEVPISLLAHEIGHSWWANLVKCSNCPVASQGLAELSAALCNENFFGEKTMRKFLKNGGKNYYGGADVYFMIDLLNISAFKDVALNDMSSQTRSSLSMVSVHKGVFVFAMLRETVGKEAFEKGIKEIIQKYADKQLLLNDIKTIMEAESGKDLTVFFEQWFNRKSAPEFKMDYTISKESGKYRIQGTIEQLREIYQLDAELAIKYKDNTNIEKIAITGKTTSFNFLVDHKPVKLLFDPDYKILRWTAVYKWYKIWIGIIVIVLFGGIVFIIRKTYKYLKKRRRKINNVS